MATRALLNLNTFKTTTVDPPFCVRRSSMLAASTRFFSSAFERAESSNAVAGTSAGDRGTEIPDTGTDPARNGLYEAKQEALDPDEDRASGVTGYMADRARDGVEKAKEMADSVGETAKKTVDGAWKAARETTEEIREAAAPGEDNSEGKPEGRDPNVDDLRRRAGGYDKARQ